MVTSNKTVLKLFGINQAKLLRVLESGICVEDMKKGHDLNHEYDVTFTLEEGQYVEICKDTIRIITTSDENDLNSIAFNINQFVSMAVV